jgi:phosphatidylserine/phosphatidylglycerophosphate/cardiolipin synthase-like enzyme
VELPDLRPVVLDRAARPPVLREQCRVDLYIHGKVIEADYGTSHAKMFIGSENFSSTSLNRNRELGLIISGHPVLSAIASTFAADFRNGKHWS